MSAIHGRFLWVELMTSDVEAATNFYRSVVGWMTEDIAMPDMTYRLVGPGERKIGGLMTIPDEAVANGAKPCWITYIGSDNVDTDTPRAASLGGRVLRAPEDIPGYGRFAVIADPAGAVFNLFTPPPSPAGPPATGLGTAGWYELHSKDWPSAFEFYHALFGWQKSRPVDMGPMGTYQLFSISGQDDGGMFNSPAAQSMSFWLVYFTVGDIDAAVIRVTQGRGTVLHGPQQVPGGGWIVQAVDPQGVHFALLGTRPA